MGLDAEKHIKLIEAYQRDTLRYTLLELQRVTQEGTWSLGQMYNHVIACGNEYLLEVENCSGLNRGTHEGKTPFAEKMFLDGAFPLIKIAVPDMCEENATSHEQLRFGFEQLKEKVATWATRVDAIDPTFKTQHDGFGWLNAREWFDLNYMHMRHHLRQRAELLHKLGVESILDLEQPDSASQLG